MIEENGMRVYTSIFAALLVAIGIVGDVAAGEIDLNQTPLTKPAMPDAPAKQSSARQFDRVIGVCHLSENPYVPQSAVNVMSVADEAVWYLRDIENIRIVGQARVSLLQRPIHGRLEDVGDGHYAFYPETGYMGNDRASLLVEVEGKKIKMEYFFRIVKSIPETEGVDPYEDLCPENVRSWKVSSNLNTNGNNTFG